MDQQLRFQVLKSQEFMEWFEAQTEAVQGLVLARLHRISVEGHFGVTNRFDNLIELKWNWSQGLHSENRSNGDRHFRRRK